MRIFDFRIKNNLMEQIINLAFKIFLRKLFNFIQLNFIASRGITNRRNLIDIAVFHSIHSFES